VVGWANRDILAPGMNIYRAPMNGRNFEYFGEDPYLAGRMAVSAIEEIQGQGVIATAKHFSANNIEYGRLDHSSDVDERTLRESYLPAFEASAGRLRHSCWQLLSKDRIAGKVHAHAMTGDTKAFL
jgi:beta-glucosidase-like glycosyl hydrolase